MDHTTFEPFSFRKHFLFLCDLEKEVWDFADPKTKRSTVWLMTVAYALICLKKSTRTLVLRKKHELLGVILIKEPYKRPKLLTTLALSSLLFLSSMPFSRAPIRHRLSSSSSDQNPPGTKGASDPFLPEVPVFYLFSALPAGP